MHCSCISWPGHQICQLPLSFTFHYPCPLHISCTKPVALLHQRYRLTCIQGASADGFFFLSSYFPCSPEVSADLCIRCISWPVHQVHQLTCSPIVHISWSVHQVYISADLCTRCFCWPVLHIKCISAVFLPLFSTLVSCYRVHQLFKQIFFVLLHGVCYKCGPQESSTEILESNMAAAVQLLYLQLLCYTILYILSKLKALGYGV